MTVNPLDLFSDKPAIAHQSIPLDRGLTVHYRHDLPGGLDAPQGLSHHMLTFFLSRNDRQVTHFDDWGEYDGAMEPGDFYLCTAGRSGFTRWRSVDRTLHIVMEPGFLRRVAADTESIDPDRLELLPVLKGRDRKLESLVQLWLSELAPSPVGDRLYRESLSALLGIHLLRQYCHTAPPRRHYQGGLSPYQLRTVLDYIQAHLHQDLGLEALATAVGLSRSHFATQFKQALGISPHQYVSQQRVEKAKQALRSQALPISAIALECGFASQSHLNKVFKQQTGLTPRAYRQQG